MSEDHKAREDRLRRKAADRGLRLCKNSRRWIRDWSGDQYHIIDYHNVVVLGASSREYDATLDDVEAFLAA